MNSQAVENQNKNEQIASEWRVDAVDFRTSAGQPQEERKVQVIHQSHPTQGSKSGGGVLAGAAAAVATTLQSTKDAISEK